MIITPHYRALASVIFALSLIASDSTLSAVEIIAHRGASADAPENTLSAMTLAWKQNADAIELDLWLSKDGKLVVFHDAETKRFDGKSRQVSKMTWAELQQLDVGAWKAPEFKGERIPTLESILETIPKGRRAVLEIKCGPEIVPELSRVLRASGRPPGEFAIISFNFDSVRESKQEFPRIEHYFLHGYKKDPVTGEFPKVEPLIRRSKAARLDGLNLQYEWPITKSFADQVKQAGLKLFVWTVNDAAVARRLAAAGVDGITTDRPQWLREQLKQQAGGGGARPNVLLVCVDDLKPLLGCYGNGTIQSPNIDRLASRGIVFERAYCNQAVCAPSRNTLLTGLRPTTLGIYDLGTNFRKAVPNAVTLPQYFKENGYRTEALGKIFHVGHGNHEDPASWSVPHWKANVVAYAQPENQPRRSLSREEALFANVPWGEANKLPRGAAYESADVADDAYPDGRIAEEAIRRLQSAKANPSEPFFLAVGFVKPHLPFCAPKKYWDLYDRQSFEIAARQTPPEGAPAYAPQFGGELRQYRGIPEQGPIPEELQRTLIHGYHAAVSYMDAQLGRVLDELDRLELTDNTIVVLWGDHGWHLGDHGIWCKHTNYEQAAHIPLLVSAPGVAKAGSRTSALVESVDLYPTLCELAALPIPTPPQVPLQLDGRSFVSILKDPAASTKEAIFHVYPRSPRGKGPILGRAVRTERYRLVEWKKPGATDDTAEFELYDYVADPAESKNLAAEQPTVAQRLRSILAKQPEAKPQLR